jgi:prepilin-type N-terminal cleavage/methylation domain-containing protein
MKTRTQRLLGRAGAACGGRAGFTLLELLVAVGALAVVAAGVAAIFEATGRTITAGKRVSAFSQYAALIERQMRSDIASMTREGVLVIRNEYADPNRNFATDMPGDEVPLFDGDTAPRLRRTDELVFFAKGQFRSARELLHPRFAAESDAARIYYGHGKKAVRPPDPVPPADPYLRPRLDDTFESQFNGTLGYQGDPDNPNRFASDWVLLRHVTLLRQPRISQTATPPGLPSGLTAANIADSDSQIALQPAASNIFRALNTTFPLTPAATVRPASDGGEHPAFASGLVDIATTDLNEIRSVLTTADQMPGGGLTGFFDPAQNSSPDGSNQGVDGLWTQVQNVGDPTLQRVHAWMDELLPANSMAITGAITRMRCESSPTDYVGVLADAGLSDLQRSERRADQMMLAASNFLPRCTEFIVEWSFGDVFPGNPAAPGYVAARAGEAVWYGLPRSVGADLVASPYLLSSPFPWSTRHTTRYRRVNGTVASWPGPANVHFDPSLFHNEGYSVIPGSPPRFLTSYFGYADPTFNPDADGDGKLESATDSASATIPWPWPKLIRVTLSLADPRDPTIEQTFQFVFDVPAGQEGR